MSRLAFGVFGLFLAGFFYFNALGYRSEAAQMPIIYSVAVAILSGLLVIGELARRRHAIAGSQDTSKREGDDPKTPVKGNIWMALTVFLVSVAYLSAIGHLGYIVSTVLFMSIVLLLIRSVSLKFSLIGIVALTTLVGVVFLGFLRLPIPLLPTFL